MKTKKLSKDTSSYRKPSLSERILEKVSLGRGNFIPFIEELKKVDSIERKKHLDQLLTSLDQQGKIFTEKPIYDNLLKYKELVVAFMKEAIGESYQTKEKISGRSFEKQKIYYIVEKINKNLEELTKKVLSEHHKILELAGKIDEIRGLLLDLYS
ncbi:YaaR family protein [bacterium]|nr:YaaR family protein [bacterium]MBU1154040.1 YaaR family protein [bacterium]